MRHKKRKKDKPCILIVAKQNKNGIKMALKLEKMLKNYTDDIHFDRSTALRFRKAGFSIKKFNGDIVITVGGDGTFLWTAQQTNVPILPVKIEGHGFLCTCNFKELTQNLERLAKKDYRIIEKMRLRCIKEKTGLIDRILHKSYPPAMNEVVFGRKRPSKILEVEFRVDGTTFDFVGDGILFSTPSGSTAYNASAGGPVVDPDLEVISIAPLYPFFSNIKPIIVPANKKIEVEIKNGDCALILDGHGGEYVKARTRFIVEKGKPVKVISISEQNFYKKLKDEFLG